MVMSIKDSIEKIYDWHEFNDNDSQRMINFKFFLKFCWMLFFFYVFAMLCIVLKVFVWPHIVSFFKLLSGQ